MPGADAKLEDRSPNLWFNPAAFRSPTAFNWGNVGRNTLTGPPIYNFDLTLSKRFATSESTNLMFRAEFFNAFNTPQFSSPGVHDRRYGRGNNQYDCPSQPADSVCTEVLVLNFTT